ncbi:MAG: FkbM family methyltransferase [Chloroflexi bacterium]|nr:FkbM family methyltransferase [Chloroflexota bacterium]
MNWSGISAQSLLGKVLRFPLNFLPPHAQVPIMQGKLRGKNWVVGSSNHGCWLGSYELDKQLVFERIVLRGSTVFDLGAHVGFYTLLASELVGPLGKVIAFEPVPRNLFYLKMHLRLNHVGNVIVKEAAVLDKSGITSFEEASNSSMGHITPQGRLQVQTIALDNLVLDGGIPMPEYMKIDIEGAEFLALAGAKSILAKSHPTIFLATHGSTVHQACCEFLQTLGYRLQSIDGLNLEQSSEILATYNAS